MNNSTQKGHYRMTAESWDELPKDERIADIQALIKSPYWMMLHEDDKSRWLHQLQSLESTLEYC